MVSLSASNCSWITTALLSLATFLIFTKPVGCEEDEESDEPVGCGQLVVPRRNLSCHECYKSIQGDACLTLHDRATLKVQKCAVDELFCVVHMEKQNTDGALTTFSRKCAKDCTPGCQSPGTAYYKAQYCYHCCQQNLCNSVTAAAVAAAADGGAYGDVTCAAADGGAHGDVTCRTTLLTFAVFAATLFAAGRFRVGSDLAGEG